MEPVEDINARGYRHLAAVQPATPTATGRSSPPACPSTRQGNHLPRPSLQHSDPPNLRITSIRNMLFSMGSSWKTAMLMPLMVVVLMLLLEAQQSQSVPVLTMEDLVDDWEKPHIVRARNSNPTCDTTRVYLTMQESCLYMRRRRRSASESDDGETDLLFKKCCQRNCSAEDFLGVCP